jgi:hypothetical protein
MARFVCTSSYKFSMISFQGRYAAPPSVLVNRKSVVSFLRHEACLSFGTAATNTPSRQKKFDSIRKTVYYAMAILQLLLRFF